jgi:hypothetical protein
VGVLSSQKVSARPRVGDQRDEDLMEAFGGIRPINTIIIFGDFG